jgi:hypothetical protein
VMICPPPVVRYKTFSVLWSLSVSFYEARCSTMMPATMVIVVFAPTH